MGRRLFRDGTSEYQINNQHIALEGMRELFLDTGVGVDAYSVIEQGRVSALLEANPAERRLIFEEAAGISKFKAKKKEVAAQAGEGGSESAARERHRRGSGKAAAEREGSGRAGADVSGTFDTAARACGWRMRCRNITRIASNWRSWNRAVGGRCAVPAG